MSLADYIKLSKKGGDIKKTDNSKKIIDEETGEILRPSRRLRISNLNATTDTKKLYSIFSEKGILIKCKVDKNKEDESLLKGIIEYEKLDSANKVLEEFKDFEIDGNKIKLTPIGINKNKRNKKKSGNDHRNNNNNRRIKKRFNNDNRRYRSNRNNRNRRN